MIKEFFKVCGIVLGSALTIYVGKELINEYDSTMEENNRLREFIDAHDFYDKKGQYTNFEQVGEFVYKVNFVDYWNYLLWVFSYFVFVD